jgi:hypothetical protein
MTMTMTMTIKKTNKHELSLSIVAIAISAMMLCAPPAFLGATAGGGILLAQAFTTAPTATAPPAIIFGSRFSAAGVVVAPYSRQHQHNMVAVDLTEKEDKKQDSTAKNPSQAFGSRECMDGWRVEFNQPCIYQSNNARLHINEAFLLRIENANITFLHVVSSAFTKFNAIQHSPLGRLKGIHGINSESDLHCS